MRLILQIAKHPIFKDNVNRVKQTNADVLKELDL